MEAFVHPTSIRLRSLATGLPETTEGTSCVNRAFKVRKKNFLFLGEKGDAIRVMVKLTHSLSDAAALSDPRVEVGKTGWVTCRFTADAPLPDDLLEAWVMESFRALAPKTVVAALDR